MNAFRMIALYMICGHVCGYSCAQTFQGIGGPITATGALSYHTVLVVSPITGIDTMNYGLQQVCLDIDHTWIGDLDIWLIAPDNTAIQLITAVGYDQDGFIGTCLSNIAEVWIAFGNAAYNGTFRPIGNLGRANNGQDPNGIWKLRIEDTDPYADDGSVISWSLTFGPTPATYTPFSQSILPIVVINTSEMHVPDPVKVDGHMRIIDNGPGVLNHLDDEATWYDGTIGIERRGSSSQQQPKRPYSIELRDVFGNDSNATLLGMPAESDWVLDAAYLDKTALRNAMSYELMRRMGHYAPRTRHVELVLDGEHQGLYVLTEKIKRGEDRVDISNLSQSDTTGAELTGGYMIKIDQLDDPPGAYWISEYSPPFASGSQEIRFVFDYPTAPNEEQERYIAGHLNAFEDELASTSFTDPLHGYTQYIDLRSFVDYFLITELSRNVDGYRRSAYLHKEKRTKGGKLFAGPLWDMDLSWGHADFCGATTIEGWAYEFGLNCPLDRRQVPFWWGRLLEDVSFRDSVRCRWDNLRADLLSSENMLTLVDSMNNHITTSLQLNFQRWPTLGHALWPEPYPAPNTSDGELKELTNWIRARAQWMDDHLPTEINGCDMNSVFALRTDSARLFPNPFTDEITIAVLGYAKDTLTIDLFDATGKQVSRHEHVLIATGQQRVLIPSRELVNGFYFVRIRWGGRQRTLRALKV